MITNNNRRIIIEFYRVYIFTELQKNLIYFFCLAHKKIAWYEYGPPSHSSSTSSSHIWNIIFLCEIKKNMKIKSVNTEIKRVPQSSQNFIFSKKYICEPTLSLSRYQIAYNAPISCTLFQSYGSWVHKRMRDMTQNTTAAAAAA